MSHELALALSIVLTSAAQVLLKSGSLAGDSWLGSFVHWRTVLGYGAFLVVTVLNVYAMQEIELKTMGAWISTTFVLVLGLSRWLLGETPGQRSIVACGLIALGILVFHAPGL